MYRIKGTSEVFTTIDGLAFELYRSLDKDTLQQDYDMYLDEVNTVKVNGVNLSPSKVLINCDFEAYKKGFKKHLDKTVFRGIVEDIQDSKTDIWGYVIEYLGELSDMAKITTALVNGDTDEALSMFNNLTSAEKDEMFQELLLTSYDFLYRGDYNNLLNTFDENVKRL